MRAKTIGLLLLVCSGRLAGQTHLTPLPWKERSCAVSDSVFPNSAGRLKTEVFSFTSDFTGAKGFMTDQELALGDGPDSYQALPIRLIASGDSVGGFQLLFGVNSQSDTWRFIEDHAIYLLVDDSIRIIRSQDQVHWDGRVRPRLTTSASSGVAEQMTSVLTPEDLVTLGRSHSIRARINRQNFKFRDQNRDQFIALFRALRCTR
jgi:hypothetical protein